MRSAEIFVDVTSIAVSTLRTDTEGMLIATVLKTIVGLAQGTCSTMTSQTLLVDLRTIFARVVAVTETDVLGVIVHQWMTHCMGGTGTGGTRIVCRYQSLQVEHFGEARDGQIVEGDGISPHSDQRGCLRETQLIEIDLQGKGLMMEDVRSIGVTSSSLLFDDRRV